MIELCKREGCTSDGTLWIPVEERLPKKNGEFLVSMEVEMAGEIYTYIDLAYFAQDLCAIDDREFHNKKGISGFYKHSWNGEVYEVKPTSWQPLPEPYKEKIK